MVNLGIGINEALLILTVLSVVLFVLGVSIALVFGVWAVGFSFFVPIFPFSNMPLVAFQQLNTFAFVAIPIFIVVGSLINEVGMASRIIDFSHSVSGWLPGSTGNTAVYTAGVFSAITGSNAATTASVGEALYDDLVDEGYKPTFAAATIASGGTLGIIIPPSVLFILYGITFGVSVSQLFLAGTIPGIMMMLGLSATTSYYAYKHDFGTRGYSFSVVNIARKLWGAKNALITIALLIGGIFSGLFTPSESAAVAFGYILLVGITGGTLRDLRRLAPPFLSSIEVMGMILPIFVGSVMIQQALSYFELQTIIADMILALGHPALVYLGMIVVMLISGSILDSVPNMILTAPLLAPAAFSLGIDPLMWGVIFMISDAIGFITPPYGLNLYIISGMTDLEYMDVAISTLPYLFALSAIWILFFVFPGLNVLAPT
jgi:C4-dicarboxylate transporter DctM subunit